MKNRLKKKVKNIKLNFNTKEIIKEPLKILKKINFKKFQESTTNSLTEIYENFKKNQNLKKINKINIEKKEKIKLIKKEKLEEKRDKLKEEKEIKNEQ